jgi:hypothetical protein
MEIPLSIFVSIYFVVAFVIVLFSIFSVLQAVRFGMGSLSTSTVAFAYIVVLVAIFAVTWFVTQDVQWGSALTILIPGISASGGT